jgi:hypothetical protein
MYYNFSENQAKVTNILNEDLLALVEVSAVSLVK